MHAGIAAVAAPPQAPSDNVKVKRGRGGGKGDGPTPEETAQVVVYRLALCVTALCWWLAYSLDFFMTSGISIIDGSVQAQAFSVADVCAGVAAIVAPTGSLVVAGVILKALGTLSVLATPLGLAGKGALGSVLGPLCLALVCAREIYWFGIGFKVDAALSILVFLAVALLRASDATDGNTGFGTLMPPTEEVLYAEGRSLNNMPAEVEPVGPPIPLSFLGSVVITVVAFGKVFENVGEDLDEEGEQFAKRSSRGYFDIETPEKRAAMRKEEAKRKAREAQVEAFAKEKTDP